MRYILTGDHWSAEQAHRKREVQMVGPDAKEALEAGIGIADCGPLGLKISWVSAHLAIDQSEKEALSKLDVQFGALFHSQDSQEGVKAEAEGASRSSRENKRESKHMRPIGVIRFQPYEGANGPNRNFRVGGEAEGSFRLSYSAPSIRPRPGFVISRCCPNAFRVDPCKYRVRQCHWIPSDLQENRVYRATNSLIGKCL